MEVATCTRDGGRVGVPEAEGQILTQAESKRKSEARFQSVRNAIMTDCAKRGFRDNKLELCNERLSCLGCQRGIGVPSQRMNERLGRSQKE